MRDEQSTPGKIDRNIYVIGDSHAGHLIPGFEALSAGKVTAMTSGGCIPFRNVDRYDSRSEIGACARKMNEYLDMLNNLRESAVVVISTMAPVYLDGTPFNGKSIPRVTGLGVELVTDPEISDHYEVFERGMRQTLTELGRNENLEVIFAIDVPELGIDFGCQYFSKELSILGFAVGDLVTSFPLSECHIAKEVYDERAGAYRKLVYKVLEEYPTVHVFDPSLYSCSETECHGYLEDYGYLYRDADHLSVHGSFYIVERMISQIALLRN